MAYSKQTWVRGEKVASTKLNHMEDGIAAISANGAIDTANLANASVTNDKLDQEAVDSNNIRTGAIITPLIYDGAVTAAKLGTDVQDILDNKANIDGSYESMTVGNAEQLVSSVGITDQTPYNFRTSGGSTEIGDREELTAVVGVSVPWNQKVSFSAGTWTNSGITYVHGSDGTITANGTATAASYMNVGATVTTFLNHKVLICGCPSGGSGTKYAIRDGYTGGDNNKDFGNGRIIIGKANFIAQIMVSSGVTVSNLVFKPQAIDLTLLLGSTIADYIYALEQANAGAGVAYFKKLFPKPYYAYNSGELLSARTNLHKMVGFNQWDEEWANGRWAGNNGVFNPAFTSYVASKNKIPVLPNTTYYFTIDNSVMSGREIVYYDADENWISDAPSSYANQAFTTPTNCHYIAFNLGGAYGKTYKHDICINLSWDGERDGEYEAYQSWTYPLDSDLELRGILKLDANNNLYADGDRYLPDGTVERRFAERAYQSGDESLADAITDGTTTVYKLTTPTTETADAYQQTQIVDDFGTEEFVDAAVEANERDVAVPVGNVTFYPQNLRKKIECLPFDFSTLIARTEKAFKATRAYAVNEFLIINNQLYKVRTSIANGATITVGTNVIATTIGSELTAILNS